MLKIGVALTLLACLAAGSPAAEGPWRAVYEQGRERQAEGRTKDAIEDLERALRLAEPAGPASEADRADMLRFLGELYSESGDDARAADRFAAAVALRPEYVACVRLAQSYAALGRLEEAKRAFERARAMKGHQADAYISEGYAMLRAGQEDEAKRDFQAIARLAPGDPALYSHLSSYYESRSDDAAALRYARLGVEKVTRDPKAPLVDRLHALIHLVMILIRERRLDEARSLAAEGLRLAPAHDPYRAFFINALGHAAEGGRQFAHAETLFRRAVAVCDQPGGGCDSRVKTVMRGALAAFYLARGRPLEARIEGRRAWAAYRGKPVTSLSEDEADQLEQIGDVLLRAGDAGTAVELERYLIGLERFQPDNPVAARAEKALAEAEQEPLR